MEAQENWAKPDEKKIPGSQWGGQSDIHRSLGVHWYTDPNMGIFSNFTVPSERMKYNESNSP